MRNPNQFNSAPSVDETLDSVRDELEASYQKDLLENALFDERMSNKDKLKTLESFAQYREERGEQDPYRQPDYYDSHAEMLENGSLEDLAIAARDAEAGQLTDVSKELKEQIADRILKDDKYEILDPDYDIDRNHPMYDEFVKVREEYYREVASYLELADPESEVNTGTPEVAETSDAEVEDGEESEPDVEGIINALASNESIKWLVGEANEEAGEVNEQQPKEDAESNIDQEGDPDEGEGEESPEKDVEKEPSDAEVDSEDNAEEDSRETEDSPEAETKYEVVSGKEYRKRKREIKKRYKAQMRHTATEVKRNLRAQKINELRNLDVETDFDKAGLRARVSTSINRPGVSLDKWLVSRYDLKAEIGKVREKYKDDEQKLKNSSLSTYERNVEIDKLRAKRDKEMKELRSKSKKEGSVEQAES